MPLLLWTAVPAQGHGPHAHSQGSAASSDPDAGAGSPEQERIKTLGAESGNRSLGQLLLYFTKGCFFLN